MPATAELKNYRQSPRKVRLVANSIRGKKVADAISLLTFANKRAADPMAKLLKSAIANAKHNHKMVEEELFIREIRVDEGVTMHRWRPRARGSASPIRKRTSHIKIVLDIKKSAKAKHTSKTANKISSKNANKTALKTAKKPVKKELKKK